MSLFTKISPVGIDMPIQGLQTLLYNQLCKSWNLQESDYSAYGRAYRNQKGSGYIPEVYIGNNEYKEVLFDDTLKALSFFGVSNIIKNSKTNATANVSLIFMVNLPALKPAIKHRADEEVHLDVERLCNGGRYGFTVTAYETGIDTVFKEYSGWTIKEGIKFRDMHPLHCFRINMNAVYNPQNSNC